MNDIEILFHTAKIVSGKLTEVNKLAHLLISKNGKYIEASVDGFISIKEINRLGEEFGDTCPIVHAEKELITIGINNNYHEEIALEDEYINASFGIYSSDSQK